MSQQKYAYKKTLKNGTRNSLPSRRSVSHCRHCSAHGLSGRSVGISIKELGGHIPFPSPSSPFPFPFSPLPSLPSPIPLPPPFPSPPLSSLSLRSRPFLIQLERLGSAVSSGLERSPSRNRFLCILALKSGIWWQQF